MKFPGIKYRKENCVSIKTLQFQMHLAVNKFMSTLNDYGNKTILFPIIPIVLFHISIAEIIQI